MRSQAATHPAKTTEVVSQMLEVSKLDTLYRDLYFERARDLMKTTLSKAAYFNLKEQAASLPRIEKQLQAAVARSEWPRARELTARISALKLSQVSQTKFVEFGREIYDAAGKVFIDPFAPGLHLFVGGSKETLTAAKNQAIKTLNTLSTTDSGLRAFYARRLADFEGLSINVASEPAQEGKKLTSTAVLQQEAVNAMQSGDLSRLNQILDKLMKNSDVPADDGKGKDPGVPLEAVKALGHDLLYTFSDQTLKAAAKLGLAQAQTRSRRNFAYLIPHGWQPSFTRDEIREWSRDQLTRLTFPEGTTDKGREAIEFFLLNPFINSGGTRYQVCLVVEDLLLEDFEEPEPRAPMPRTDLLATLGFERRWGLSRLELESALTEHGPRILRDELALDPEAFRLVAIPADIYTHLGSERGWGQKEIWTHFDGYRVLEGGKLQALAGGDRRFGGSHDVVSFSPTYDSDKVLARFAVVQRKRMMTWQRN